MSVPEIDFERIRPHGGSRKDGFEELCAQLASLEPLPDGHEFVRTGRGADAGVECYTVAPEGSETGWQAKYVFDWEDGLGSQLNKSIESAFAKHPALDKYIVCLPYALPDGRQEGRKSQRQKFDDWRTKWIRKFAAAGRTLEIELWDSTQLAQRLTVDEPQRQGRLFYWFSITELTPEWFRDTFQRAKADLGSRYTPASHVELPLRKIFSGLTREMRFDEQASEWKAEVLDLSSRLTAITGDFADPLSGLDDLKKALEGLVASLGDTTFRPDQQINTEVWTQLVEEGLDAGRVALASIYEGYLSDPEGKSREKIDGLRFRLNSIADRLHVIRDALAGPEWQLVNADAMLLTGEAGSGKSHLLADVVGSMVGADRPATMVLGSSFVEGEPWRQMMTNLHLPPGLPTATFLGALDAAGQAAGVRTLVCVDAINERHGPAIWPDRMASFLKLAESFPHVVIALSCRTTYVAHVVPEKVSSDILPRIEHTGFADHGGETARGYLAMRGIVMTGAPNLVPEMFNPLFLKTLCDTLEREGQREIPRGLRGVTSLFKFYTNAIVSQLERRMRLDMRLRQLLQSIEAFASRLAATGRSYMPYAEAHELLEAFVRSDGDVERSLLTQFESEGILSVESFADQEGALEHEVRFTFERYGDHVVAKGLLEANVAPDDVPSSFEEGTPLGDFVFGERQHHNAGVIEAMAIQLPESYGREILDVGREVDWTTRDAFRASFEWRVPECFTTRTMELAELYLEEDELLGLLVRISTEPGNLYNADHLDRKLRGMTMPERDRFWSLWLLDQGDASSSVMTLVQWAMRSGLDPIEDERSKLAAIALTWLLTASHRGIRDKATKGLAAIFATRLSLATTIIDLFDGVDDLYVIERVFAAAYGAALQGLDQNRLEELAQKVFDIVFANGQPPLNELLRDHARCILDLAAHHGAMPETIDRDAYRPPYRSAWPPRHVTDAEIEAYREGEDGAHVMDDIVASCVSDGDFARYEIDKLVNHWAAVPASRPHAGEATALTDHPPTYEECAELWMADFVSGASEDQFDAFEKVLAAAKAMEGSPSWGNSPKHAAMKKANEDFERLLEGEAWEVYRTTAKGHIEHGMFSDRPPARRAAARFDGGHARRWICWRAHDLGWTAGRFGGCEHTGSQGRHDHEIERIGKKYQWLAFFELAARMADNLPFLGSSYGDETVPYMGVIPLGLRDMDPSLLITSTFYDPWRQWPRCWWIPVDPKLPHITPLERIDWLRGENDILNNIDLIDLVDPSTGKAWLPLKTFSHWRGSGFEDGEKSMLRETWFRTTCILVRAEDEAKLLEDLAKRTLISDYDLPSFEFDTEYHLGEYPWRRDVREQDIWCESGGMRSFCVEIRPTAFEMLRERSGHDYSIEESINMIVPTPFVIEVMGLRLRNGRRPEFVDRNGNITVFDPSVTMPGPEAALVEKTAFADMLEKEGLKAIWVVGGEKAVYGGSRSSSGYGGRVDHTGIYRLQDGQIEQVSLRKDEEPPQRDQLLALLKCESLPEGLEDWTKSSSL